MEPAKRNVGDFIEQDVTVMLNPVTRQFVIMGTPMDDTVNYQHNCDEMGCNSLDHVIYRGRL